MVSLLRLLVSVAVGGMVAAGCTSSADEPTTIPPPAPAASTTVTEPPTTLPEPTTTTSEGVVLDADAENVLFDPGPLTPRGGHSVVWTGSEMIVWGGWRDENGARRFADGAAFDPVAGTWRQLPESPLSARQYHIAVWTGEEMLIVGGGNHRDGAAYHPESDSWRLLPDSPARIAGEPIEGVTGWVWTGEVVVVWQAAANEVAAYDPAQDMWRILPPTPLEVRRGVLRWSGEHLYAVGANTFRHPEEPRRVPLELARLAHDESRWEVLPEAELWTDEINIGAMPELTAWVGDSLVAWTDAGDMGPTLVFDPDTEEWQEAAPTPMHGCEATPEPLVLDERVLAFGWCGDDAIFDPVVDTWTPVLLDGIGQARYAVWTGTEVLNWGDTCCYGTGGTPFSITAWRYQPPAGSASLETGPPSSTEIQGRLPDGRGYRVSFSPGLIDNEPDGVSAAIVINPDQIDLRIDGRPCTSPCTPVLGITRFQRQSGQEPTFTNGVFLASSGDWTMTIRVYQHIIDAWGDDIGEMLLEHINPVEVDSGLPAFQLSGPLRWATDHEIPLQMQVSYPDFVVQRECEPSNVGCSPSGSVQVIPTEVVFYPAPSWDHDREVFVYDTP